MTALTQTQQNNNAAPNRAETPRRTPRDGQPDAAAPARKSSAAPTGEDSALFGELLLPTFNEPPPPVSMQWQGGLQAGPQSMSNAEAPPPSPTRAWQQIEPSLCGIIDKQPSGPVSMTLLLPILGEVDARVSPLAAGWDISLRFAPQAMSMIAAHQERCRESLRRRMACPVRLRFEQRGGRA